MFTRDIHAFFADAHSLVAGFGPAIAQAALRRQNAKLLNDAGFNVRSVPLDAIEAGGASLRCCIGEIF